MRALAETRPQTARGTKRQKKTTLKTQKTAEKDDKFRHANRATEKERLERVGLLIC